MQDTSYVNLSLNKYNELYDKAKKYDEISDKMTDDLKSWMDRMCKTLEQLSATTEEVDEEFHEGQQVELIKRGSYTSNFSIGEILTITNLLEDDSEECIAVTNGDMVGYVSKKQIKKLNKKKEEN